MIHAAARGGPEADAWPFTNRLLPWSLAGFLAMMWLVPFDAIALPVDLPFDSKLDRVAMVVIGGLWLFALLARGPRGPRSRDNVMHLAVLGFVTVAVVSVIINLETLTILDQTSLAVKKLALLASYVLFFFIVATSVRPSEIRPFSTLFLVLASIAAVGTIWEYRTGFNAFYAWSDQLLVGFDVSPPPADPMWGRVNNTGPTAHALAIATMLAIALPFAVVRLMGSAGARQKVLYAGATALLLAGNMATIRKTGAVVPAVTLLTLLLFRPRNMLRLLPIGLVILIAVNVMAPGAMVSIKAQLLPGRFQQSSSTLARKDDYRATKPDVRKKMALGRGYGTYDPHVFRFLDNQLLMLRIETGMLGMLAYILMIVAAVGAAYPAIRSRHPERAPPALAAAAGAVGFGVANFLYDALAFPHAPYLFFFLAGLGVVASSGLRMETKPIAARPLPRDVPLARRSEVVPS